MQPKPGLLYVLYLAKVHVFTESGEVEIPDGLRQPLASMYFGARRSFSPLRSDDRKEQRKWAREEAARKVKKADAEDPPLAE